MVNCYATFDHRHLCSFASGTKHRLHLSPPRLFPPPVPLVIATALRQLRAHHMHRRQTSPTHRQFLLLMLLLLELLRTVWYNTSILKCMPFSRQVLLIVYNHNVLLINYRRINYNYFQLWY